MSRILLPGYELFETMKRELGDKKVIAEDLGYLTPSVIKLVKKTGFPGMKILQFAFDSREESDYLPHNYTKNCIVYTGTHDNETTRGWFDNLPRADKKFCKEYLGIHYAKDAVWELRVEFYSLAAQVPQYAEQSYLNGGTYYDYYETADGRYLSVGSLEPQFMQGLAQILNLPILLEKGASLDPQVCLQVKHAIQDKIKTQSFATWQQVFAQHDVCVEPVFTLDEALHSPLAQQRGWTVEVPIQQNATKTETQLACPIKFSRSQMRYDYIGQALGAGQWSSQTKNQDKAGG